MAIRDAALKMVATNESTGSGGVNTTSNASNAIIRQYIAQNYEHQNSEDPDSMEDEERRRMLEESDAARELLKNYQKVILNVIPLFQICHQPSDYSNDKTTTKPRER